MRQVLHNSDKDLLLNVPLNDEQEVRRQWGVPSGTVVFEYGYVSFTTDGKIELSQPIYGIKSIRLIVDIDTTTEDVIKLSSTHSVSIAAGTVTATGFSSPTIYVDGVATSTVVAGKAEITITTATLFVADNIILGYISSYLEGKIYEVQLYNIVLDSGTTINLYSNSRYMTPQLDTADHQRILHVTARNGVVQEISDQNTITDTDVSVFKDGSIRVVDFNGSSSLIESTLADNVNTIMFWAKPKTADERILDIGSGNSIRVIGGVLTAAWANDLYVDGATGTAIKHNEWNHIVCRVDTALALTDIVLGKQIGGGFYNGMLDDVIFVDGIITDAEISQVFSSSKHLYQK